MTLMKPKKTGFIAMLLSLLGLAPACEIIVEPCMYGTPNAKFDIKGTVTDEKGTPIEDIKILVSGVETGSYTQEFYPMADTLKTDAKGTYVLNTSDWPWGALKINAIDTDGDLHGGQFAPDSVIVSGIKFEKDKKDDNGWYAGEAKIDVPVIKLKKK